MPGPSSRTARGFVSTLVASLTIGTYAAEAQSRPPVDTQYRRFFANYKDTRSIGTKVLNAIGMENGDVGHSFALLVGVSRYPNMSLIDKELPEAAADIRHLRSYLANVEYFDEIVVLENGDVTMDNLQYFLQAYFPARLRKFPKSRFLFAFSGHGMTEDDQSFVLRANARNKSDRDNGINLAVLRVLMDPVVESGHQVLVMLNACYGGAFLSRSFGGSPIPKNPGAHAITAGGSNEQTWANKTLGDGSIFFEKTIAGLSGLADNAPDDGVITTYELATYLRREIQLFTDQRQNPQLGDISRHGSKGEFFFLNRSRNVNRTVAQAWESSRSKAFGVDAAVALATGDSAHRAGDYVRALEYYGRAADGGQLMAMSYLGWMYYDGKGVPADTGEAVKWFRRAADRGHAAGLDNLGVMYMRGHGVSQDYSEAKRLFDRAAALGNTDAMGGLGYIYQNGLGVTRNDAEAVRWFRRAADAGDAYGMSSLGVMYRDGHGVPQNYPEAIRLLGKGAESGTGWAATLIGYLYRDGIGVPADQAEAVRWFRVASANNDPEGMTALAFATSRGLGTPLDHTEAIRLYRIAADRGNMLAMLNLGIKYRDGKGVRVDYDEARHWLERSAEAGQAGAWAELGYLYANGYGVPKDLARAIALYRKDVDAGDLYSSFFLGVAYRDGQGVPKDLAEALIWFNKSAAAGHTGAMRSIGDLYEYGRGVAPDRALAVQWYKKAARLGDEWAQRSLVRLGETF
jgi:TPR repeat protein